VGDGRIIRSANNMWVAQAEDFNSYDRDDEADANARLIAAAPELLAALEWTTDRFAAAVQHDKAENELADCGHCGVIEEARAAIRKARGEA
jgi:hypothetical protein